MVILLIKVTKTLRNFESYCLHNGLKVTGTDAILEIFAMKMNVGSIDRLVRLLLASTLFYLGLFSYSGTGLGAGLAIAGGVMLVTALVGFCGLYQLLGICTSQPNE